MLLKEIIKNTVSQLVSGSEDTLITSIEYNSREVKAGSMFVAVKGLKVDGHDYIEQAIKNGAAAIAVQSSEYIGKYKDINNISIVKVADSAKALSMFANAFYGYPANNMTLIGITGTNGKTTTTYLLKSILEEAGKKTGVIGTIGYLIGDEFTPADKTTPESVKIFEFLKKMADSSVSHVLMEVSSIALKLDRVHDLKFDVAAFTNLTQDHLDFHITFESYFESKKILFDENLKKNGTAIFNCDDNFGRKIAADFTGNRISYGLGSADYSGKILSIGYEGLNLSVKNRDSEIEINSPLTGKFNAYNILLAFAIAKSIGLDNDTIKRGIEKTANVDGRFKKIRSEKGFWSIVDYSHTPDSLKNALETIRQILVPGSKVITIFGCGGNRDASKRPIMGKIADELSDVVIVTSDNPRFENPQDIINSIVSGISRKENLFIESDRKEAIRIGISMAEKNDVVLVAGKGHEAYQEIKETKYHFDDSEIINELIR